MKNEKALVDTNISFEEFVRNRTSEGIFSLDALRADKELYKTYFILCQKEAERIVPKIYNKLKVYGYEYQDYVSETRDMLVMNYNSLAKHMLKGGEDFYMSAYNRRSCINLFCSLRDEFVVEIKTEMSEESEEPKKIKKYATHSSIYTPVNTEQEDGEKVIDTLPSEKPTIDEEIIAEEKLCEELEMIQENFKFAGEALVFVEDILSSNGEMNSFDQLVSRINHVEQKRKFVANIFKEAADRDKTFLRDVHCDDPALLKYAMRSLEKTENEMKEFLVSVYSKDLVRFYTKFAGHLYNVEKAQELKAYLSTIDKNSFGAQITIDRVYRLRSRYVKCFCKTYPEWKAQERKIAG